MSVVGQLLDLLQRPTPANGRKSAAAVPDITELESAIRALQTERDEAERAIRAMPAQREALLEQADTDDAIAELERATDRQHLTVERLDRLEKPLFERLNALRTAERRALWVQLRTRYVAAGESYHNALLNVLPRLDEMAAVAGEMAAAGFVEVRSRPPVPWAGKAIVVENYRLSLAHFGELAAPAAREQQSPMTRELYETSFGSGGPTRLENLFTRGGRPVDPDPSGDAHDVH